MARLIATTCAILALLAAQAQADLSPRPWSQDAGTATWGAQAAARAGHAAGVTGTDIALDSAADVWHLPSLPPIHAGTPDRTEPQTVAEIPPAPDSATLFLCAVGTMGAWQVSRSARRVHMIDVPHWLHTSGPAQIGHAVAVDPLELDFQPLPAVLSTLASDSGNARPLHSQTVWRVPIRSERFIAPESPRAPPHAA